MLDLLSLSLHCMFQNMVQLKADHKLVLKQQKKGATALRYEVF